MLEDLLKRMPAGTWLASPELSAASADGQKLPKKEAEKLYEYCKTALDAGEEEGLTNFLFLGFAVGGGVFLKSVRSKGLLRLSRSDYSASSASRAVSKIVAASDFLEPDVSSYLRSVSFLHSVAVSAKGFYTQIADFLRDQGTTGLKTLLATLEFAAMYRDPVKEADAQKQGASTNVGFFDSTDLADAFSAILAIREGLEGVPDTFWPVSQDAATNDKYLRLLTLAAHLVAFRSWEIMLDRYDYRITFDPGGNVFTLQPPSLEFLRARELGFIQTNMQRQANAQNWSDKGGLSASTLGEWLAASLQKTGDITFRESPIPRYTFNLPMPILTGDAGPPGTTGYLFMEEFVNLMQAEQDLLASPEKILDFSVNKTSSLFLKDVVKVSRVFRLLRAIMSATLKPLVSEHKQVVMNSIIPAWTRKDFKKFLLAILDESKVEPAIHFFAAGLSKHKDIHYRPLLDFFGGAELALPVHVFGNSDYLRNAFKMSADRLYADGTEDPLPSGLAKNFEQQGLHSWHGIKYSWPGKKPVRDIDVLLLIGDHLFAFECKNSLLPTDDHEAMTSLDTIEKAAEQLDALKAADCDGFRDYLGQKVDHELPRGTPLTTGIVVSNRMFTGLRVSDHPVRGAYELLAYVTAGTVALAGETYRAWSGERCTAADLRGFLTDDTLHQHYWNALELSHSEYFFPHCSVRVPRMGIELITLAGELGLQAARETLIDVALEKQKLADQDPVPEPLPGEVEEGVEPGRGEAER